MKRHESDQKENSRKVLVANQNTLSFEEKLWKDLHVGMIVKIKQDEFFPADLILISSSAPKGICYIETKNLDGETNLKHKLSLKPLVELSNDDESMINNFRGAYVECENPNEMLYRFEGTMIVNSVMGSLSVDQVLLRGSSLRNTEYIYGMVVFTGHETKIMMNSVNSRSKFSKLEKSTNRFIVVIVIMQLVLSIIAATLNTVWEYVY